MKKIAEVKNAKDLFAAIADAYKQEGKGEEFHNIEKAVEVKKAEMALEMKANEVVHTTNTNYGAELIPGAIQTTDFLDLTPKYSYALSFFRGFHWRNMPMVAEVPVIGEIGLHDLSTEWTTWTPTAQIAQGKGKLPTDKVTVRQKQYLFSIDVSEQQNRFTNIIDVITTINRKLAASAAKTQEYAIFNGDTATGATGNVNSDDGAPASTKYYLGGDGIRKSNLAAATDLGTLDFADFLTLLKKVWNFAAVPSDVAWFLNSQTYTKALGVSEFLTASINGKWSTVNTWALTNVLGLDVFTSAALQLTEADGKLSVTWANNVKWQLHICHKDLVQYGYNGDYQIEIFRVPGKGWQILGYYFMWYGIATAANIQADNGNSDVLSAAGINITV